MTNLYMIRHGEAVSNVEPIIGGMKGDKGLTALGKIQAERLRDRLAATGEIQADVLIASTLPRAAQTAQAIAPALGLPIIWDAEFQELRPGDQADGMSDDEARAKFGTLDFRKMPFQPYYPGGENLGQFRLRVANALDRTIREHRGKTIVVVSHGGVVNSAFLYLFNHSTLGESPVGCFPHNTSITQWYCRLNDDQSEQWYLRSFNDVIHLRDIETGKLIHWEDVAAQPTLGSDQLSAPIPGEKWEHR